MRSVQLTGLAVLVLTAACSVHVGGGGAPPPPQARRAPPPPPPPPVHPAGNQASAVAPAGPSPSLNVAKVQAIKARNPKPCGYMEVSPNNWVHIDCQKYTASTHTIAHLSVRKHGVVKAHQTLIRPITKSMRGSHIPAPGHASTAVAAAKPAAGGPVQVGENLPAAADHRADNTEGPIKNQGGVGSCTAHSLSAALDNAAIRAGNLQPGDRNRMASPLHVWSRYGIPNMGAAADGNIAQPVALYQTWPQSDAEACKLMRQDGEDCAESYGVQYGSYQNDPVLMQKLNTAEKEGVYKIASIEKLEAQPPDMDELESTLAGGADLWVAFQIDGSKFSNSVMKNAVIPDWTSPNGGHAIVLSGYRDAPGGGKQFLIHNSWGESWGDKGYAWVSEAMVKKWMYFAYKVKITNGVPKADLTDDDCAPDELVDLGTGLCAVMCDGAQPRPNNGCKK